MNTDVILDFVVKYYLWFIIGGGALILAIIGFVADKKKLFKNHKKKGHIESVTSQSDDKKETIVKDSDAGNSMLENTSNEEMPNMTIENELNMTDSLNNSDSDDIDNQTLYSNEYEVNNNDVNLNSDIDNINTDAYTEHNDDILGVDEPLSIGNENAVNNDNLLSKENEESIVDSYNNEDSDLDKTIVIPDGNVKDELAYIDNLEINNEKSNNDYQTIVESNDSIDSTSNVYNDDKVSDVEVIDINGKNDDNNSSDKVTDKQLIDLNDKEDDSLTISYSKLKEMVEEIISGQEHEEKKEDKINDVQNISTFDDYVSNISKDIKTNNEPNLDQNEVEKIKQLDEDEDDVWKF